MARRFGLPKSGAGPGRGRSVEPDSAGSSGRVEVMALDLSSLASVRTFAAELAARLAAGTLPPLHGLACNAGVQSGTKRSVTADGF